MGAKLPLPHVDPGASALFEVPAWIADSNISAVGRPKLAGTAPAAPPAHQYFTKEEVASELRISVRTVSRAISSGHLKAHIIGRLVRITPAALIEYLER